MTEEILDIRWLKSKGKKKLQVYLNGNWDAEGFWIKGKWKDVRFVTKKKGRKK